MATKPFHVFLSIDKVVSILLTETMMSIDNKTPWLELKMIQISREIIRI